MPTVSDIASCLRGDSRRIKRQVTRNSRTAFATICASLIMPASCTAELTSIRSRRAFGAPSLRAALRAVLGRFPDCSSQLLATPDPSDDYNARRTNP
jgi:hypothetical protein